MKRFFPVLLTSLVLCSCRTMPASFVDMARDPVQAQQPVFLSDTLTIRYANEIAEFLRQKANGARITREMSNSAAATLAKLAAPGTAIFGFSMRTGSVLGLAGSGVTDFQGIFNAQGRSEAARDGVRFIEEAIVEYLSFNQTPSNQTLTQNGVTLLQRTMASVHLVEKTLTGSIPTPVDMAKATEAMSPVGASTTVAGSDPVNNIPADPHAADVRAAYSHLVKPRVVEVRTTKTLPPKPLPKEEELLIAFTAEYRAFSRDGTIPAATKTQVYLDTLTTAKVANPDAAQFTTAYMQSDVAQQENILGIFRIEIEKAKKKLNP